MITERLCGRFDGYVVLLGDFLELREEGRKAGLLGIEDAPLVLDGATRLLPAITSRWIGRRLCGRGLRGPSLNGARLTGADLHGRWLNR